MTEEQKPTAPSPEAVELTAIPMTEGTDNAIQESTKSQIPASSEAAPETIPEQAPQPIASAGAQLRALREGVGMSLSELANLLKVPERKLDLLETDQYSQLPDATFVRALASSVCRTLKADNAPILAVLPSATAPGLAKVDEGINAPFHKPSDRVTPEVVWDQNKQTILIVVGLAVAAILLYLLPQSWLTRSEPQKTSGIVTEQVASPMIAASAVVTEPQPAASEAVGSPLSASSQVMMPAPPQTPAAQTIAVGLAPIAQSPIKPASTAVPAVSGKYVKELVQFEAKADTWIEVTQADGQVLLRRTLRSGEKEVLGGTPPLNVSIGNADKTRVTVKGRGFDLAPVSRENIARFKVE